MKETMKKNIGFILKKQRIASELSIEDAINKLKEYGIDIKPKTLYGYENNVSTPNADIFIALCKIYNYQNVMEALSNSVDDVLFTNKEWNIIEKYRSLDDVGKSHIDYELNRELNRMEELQKQTDYIKELKASADSSVESNIDMRLINYYYRIASAGTGQILFDMPPTKRIEIPNIPKYRKADYAIGVNGSSMEPVYHDGDTLLVEMTEEIEVGDIGIFRVNGESYVKKLGETELISLNPNFENIPLNESAGCMGKVIGKISND